MGKRIWSLAVALLLAAILAAPARAHANLVKSEPAAGAILQAAPKELVLEFSEELDANFTRVQLFNSANQNINPGPGTIDPASPKVLRLMVGELPKGSYTAIWRARSAADGHISEGSVPFGIGVAAGSASLIPAPGTPDPATETPPPLDAAARWLNLLALAVAFGGISFGLLVWRPAYRRATKDERPKTDRAADPHHVSSFVVGRWSAADDAMTASIRKQTLYGGLAFLLASLFFLATQAADAAGVPLFQALGAPALRLLAGRSGQLILARMILVALAIALAWRLPPAGRGATWRWWVGLALAGAIGLTFSLSAHAAAQEQGRALAVALDWLHIVAMVAWIGGLVSLAGALRAARRDTEQALPLAILIARFSWLALPCVLILGLTGLYSYLLHVGTLELLLATTYGRALSIKLGLFALLILLGALNLLIFSPLLRRAGGRAARRLGRAVRVELALGALVLLAVGAMTSVAPSTTAWEAHQQRGLAQEAREGDVDLTLRVAPAQIGDNEWAVDVSDRRPGAKDAPAKVILRFDMIGMEMEPLQIDTTTQDKQRYTARGSYTAMGGRWHVEVVLRRAGFDDVRHTFVLDIVRSPAAAAAP